MAGTKTATPSVAFHPTGTNSRGTSAPHTDQHQIGIIFADFQLVTVTPEISANKRKELKQ
jgi:hypothetical protein